MARIRPLIICALSAFTALPALAEVGAEASVDAKPKPVPWRGSTISLTSGTTALSFDKSAEQDYNPYSAVSLTLAPRLWFADDYFARAVFSLTHEFTEADDTTYVNETLASDTTVGVGGRLGDIPVADITTVGYLDLRLPTSKPSQAASLYFAVSPTLRLSKTFSKAAGLQLFYTLQATRFVHEFTTRQNDVTSRCGSGGATCDPFLHTGVRNPRWRFANGVGVSLTPVPWFTVGANAAVIQDYLHDDIETTANNPFDASDGRDTRELMSYGVDASFVPFQGVWFTLAAQTTSPQLQPNGGYYRPFFNRFTVITADITYSFGGQSIQQLQEES